jgi:beta-1,4-mannosyl-glycoprotein beta-1,4-N-acetylglucosaminyltransferase
MVSREMKFRKDFFSNIVHAALNSRLVKSVFHRKGFRRRLRNNHPFVLKFQQPLFRYFLNCRSVQPPFSYGTRMLHFRDFSCAEEVRHSGYKTVQGGGWHFSWMGGAQRIRQKLAAYAHQERNLPQNARTGRIEQAMREGRLFYDRDKRLEFIPLNDSFPRYLLEHPEKFSTWIRPV